ncbi:MAG: cation-efflux pump [Chloroflexi bacterium]|nr:cation-efflux pump [Chloroflexota bacterium]
MTATLEQQTKEKGSAASSSVVAAIFLTAMKLIVGIMTGSLGILAEAAHSALDLGAALITWFAVHVSDRPADETHLFGHGKVENLSALAETILLLVTCVWIIYEAINRLFFEMVEVDPSIWAFLVMGISIAIDWSRSRVLYRAAKKYNSQALEADALHFSTDIWSSSVVIIGLALVWLGERIGQKSVLMRADAVAALVVALIVIYVSIRLGKRTIDALLDTAPRGLAAQITATVARVSEAQQVLRARVRGSGSQMFVELWVAVPRHWSFEESHAVTHQIRAAVHSVSPNADVVVTTVPSVENEGIFETIQSVAARNHLAVHNISTHLTKKGVWIDLDLEVAPSLTFDQAHAIATDLETRLRAELGAAQDAPRIADINVHIEPRAEELVKGQDLTPQDAAKYIAQIRAFSQTIPHVRACQDIDVQRLDGQVYLAFHLRLDSDLSIADVHSATEEMENRLRREFPFLGRVVIHAEPAQVKSQK